MTIYQWVTMKICIPCQSATNPLPNITLCYYACPSHSPPISDTKPFMTHSLSLP